MTDDPSRCPRVQAAESLDRLQQKKEQDQAYNEIHCRKAFKLGERRRRLSRRFGRNKS